MFRGSGSGWSKRPQHSHLGERDKDLLWTDRNLCFRGLLKVLGTSFGLGLLWQRRHPPAAEFPGERTRPLSSRQPREAADMPRALFSVALGLGDLAAFKMLSREPLVLGWDTSLGSVLAFGGWQCLRQQRFWRRGT